MSLSRSVLCASRNGVSHAKPVSLLARNYSQDLTIKHRTGMPQVAAGPYGFGRCVLCATLVCDGRAAIVSNKFLTNVFL